MIHQVFITDLEVDLSGSLGVPKMWDSHGFPGIHKPKNHQKALSKCYNVKLWLSVKMGSSG